MNNPRLVPVGTTLPARTIDDAEGRPASSSSLVVERESGSLFASLRFARRTLLRLEFALDVVNASEEPLLATIYARPFRGEELPVAPYSLWVDARTEAYIVLPMSSLLAATCTAVSVRIQGRTIHHRVEAAIPRPGSLLWAAGGALVAAAIAAAVVGAHPRVTSLQAPSNVVGGTRVSAIYRIAGAGNATWELDDLHGGRLDGGTLAAAGGTFQFAVPKSRDRETYVVRVASQGRFGEASSSLPMVADTPVPPASPLRVSAFSVDRATLNDGDAVKVRYRTDARSGEVQAVDAQGTVWARAALSPSGISTLKLPTFGREKELQIRIVAKSGAQYAQSGVGVAVVVPSPSPNASTAPTAGNVPPGSGSSIAVDSSIAHPGATVVVRVLRHFEGLHIALIDSHGGEVDGRDVAPSTGSVALRVPANASGTLTVVATYTEGQGQNSDVKTLRVVR